ncbi:MAG: hypothetical protein LBJ10_06305, partial [Clostridiales bacterium]|nr:hypothetical protein [Clostridiales bacterium]
MTRLHMGASQAPRAAWTSRTSQEPLESPAASASQESWASRASIASQAPPELPAPQHSPALPALPATLAARAARATPTQATQAAQAARPPRAARASRAARPARSTPTAWKAAILCAIFLAGLLCAGLFAAWADDPLTAPIPYASPSNDDEAFFNFRLQYLDPFTDDIAASALPAEFAFDPAGFWEHESYFSRAIAFATTQPSIARVEYGLTASYGQATEIS